MNTNDHNNPRLMRLTEVMSMVALRRSSIYGLNWERAIPRSTKNRTCQRLVISRSPTMD
ncbi:AlpA family phage regulatory protein [Acidithiobacillus thiooxidans]|nr:AlpA family phage regulatory protein [Acidithiobacillus thiooxidans]